MLRSNGVLKKTLLTHNSTFFTDYDETSPKFIALFISKDEIRIHGVDNKLSYISLPRKPEKNAWTTILIEWLGVKYQRQRIYTINNEKRGKFTGNTPEIVSGDTLFLGGEHDGTKYLNGSISSFEIIESIETTRSLICTISTILGAFSIIVIILGPFSIISIISIIGRGCFL